MHATPLVTARGVGRDYGTRTVLADVDLDVHAGELLGLIGPNGGGKSTLLLLLAGLVQATRGEVRLDGRLAHEVAMETTGSVGLITAVPGFYPLLTGWENLRFFGGLFGLSRAEVEAKGAATIEEMGLGPHLETRVGAYSSGMQQKLSLVRAMLTQPRLLLLDEPTANLDPVSAHALYRVMRQRADEGLAVVVVTHDLHAVEQVCDRVAVIRHTVRHVEALPGHRQPPAPSRLLALYARYAEESL